MKRWWFQIHLSTAIVLMFVAGAILFINFEVQRSYSAVIRNPTQTVVDYYDGWGWPLLYNSRGSFAFSPDSGAAVERDLLSKALEFHEDCPRKFSLLAAIVDGLAGLAIIFIVAILSELAIRRRETNYP